MAYVVWLNVSTAQYLLFLSCTTIFSPSYWQKYPYIMFIRIDKMSCKRQEGGAVANEMSDDIVSREWEWCGNFPWLHANLPIETPIIFHQSKFRSQTPKWKQSGGVLTSSILLSFWRWHKLSQRLQSLLHFFTNVSGWIDNRPTRRNLSRYRYWTRSTTEKQLANIDIWDCVPDE